MNKNLYLRSFEVILFTKRLKYHFHTSIRISLCINSLHPKKGLILYKMALPKTHSSFSSLIKLVFQGTTLDVTIIHNFVRKTT